MAYDEFYAMIIHFLLHGPHISLTKKPLDEMYESPSRKDIEQIIIDKENVTDDIQPKMVLKEKKESKDSKPA